MTKSSRTFSSVSYSFVDSERSRIVIRQVRRSGMVVDSFCKLFTAKVWKENIFEQIEISTMNPNRPYFIPNLQSWWRCKMAHHRAQTGTSGCVIRDLFLPSFARLHSCFGANRLHDRREVERTPKGWASPFWSQEGKKFFISDLDN